MKHKSVSICCFEEGPIEYVDNAALVAVDVIRATTTAVTAIAMGRECHLAPTLHAAFDKASRLSNALLAGEIGGDMPPGFDLSNSPAELAVRSDVSRPLVLLSSTGTRLMYGSGSATLRILHVFATTARRLIAWSRTTMWSHSSAQERAANFAKRIRCVVPGSRRVWFNPVLLQGTR